MTQILKHAVDKVREDTEQMKQGGSQLVKDMKNIGGSVQDLAEDSIDLAKKTLSGYYDNAEKTLKTRVRNQPIQAMLIALGVGYLIGRLR